MMRNCPVIARGEAGSHDAIVYFGWTMLGKRPLQPGTRVHSAMQPNKLISLTLLLSGLAGCATLPTSGPTGKQVGKTAIAADSTLPIQLVELDTVGNIPKVVSATLSPGLADNLTPPPTDMIGPGDVLDISIYEVGITLFSSGAGGAAGAGAGEKGAAIGSGGGAQTQKLPPTRVDDNGNIFIPYVGRLHVAGRTLGAVETMIRRSLRSLSQNPQVLISLSQAVTNSVIVGGEVARPGRLVLQTNHETLSDVVALAGGYKGNARDLTLRIVRHAETLDLRFDDIVGSPALDVRAYPGDRLMLISAPRSFSVLGASGRVEQIPFTRSSISLTEAIAAAGGVNPNFGDPAAIFVFRYVTDANGVEVPIVYHLNMMKTGGYFLGQRFVMRDKDVIYFGSAAANQPGKLFQLISQLFTPLVTVTAATQALNTGN
jgi:polysaccharide biosynthesis/export protein